MGNVGASFSGQVARWDMPIIIATNRNSAVMLPVRLRYDADGYLAGQTLARNTTDGWYEKYASGGSSGTDVARAVLFENHPVEDFDAETAQGSTMGVAIFGGCTVFKDKLVDWDSDALTDVGGKEITDASGVTLIKF